MTSWQQAQQLFLPLHEFKLRQTNPKKECQHRFKRGRKPKTPDSFFFSLMLIVRATPRLKLKLELLADVLAGVYRSFPRSQMTRSASRTSQLMRSVFRLLQLRGLRLQRHLADGEGTAGRLGLQLMTRAVAPPRGQMRKQRTSKEKCLNYRNLHALITFRTLKCYFTASNFPTF